MRRFERAAAALTALALSYASPVRAEDAVELPASVSQGRVAILSECVLSPPAQAGSESAFVAGPLGGVLLAIGDAVIPQVTSFIFDRIMAHARAQTLARSSTTSAVTAGGANDRFWIYGQGRLARNFRCVLFVRPAHAGSVIDPNAQARLHALNPNWRELLNRAMPGLQLGSSDAPEMVAEFAVEPISAFVEGGDQTRLIGFRLRPVTLAFAATGARRTSAAHAKDIAFSINVEALSPDDGGGLASASIYTHTFAFNDVAIGSVQGSPSPSVASISPLTIAAGPAAPVPSARVSLGGEHLISVIPLTVTITETETETGGDLQRQVLDAIAAKKSEITAPVDERLRQIIRHELSSEREAN